MHLAIRVAGTLAVAGLLVRPMWAPDSGPGLLVELRLLPFPGVLLVVAGFLGLVALYCRTLQRTMDRSGSDRSTAVWWMFAVPVNFVEDFYIVHRVAAAIDGRLPRWPRASWSALGHGWCAAQVLSLFPGMIGRASGAVAVVLWLAHWMLTLTINRALR